MVGVHGTGLYIGKYKPKTKSKYGSVCGGKLELIGMKMSYFRENFSKQFFAP